jgi:very-short-patch-repair endonuclease
MEHIRNDVKWEIDKSEMPRDGIGMPLWNWNSERRAAPAPVAGRRACPREGGGTQKTPTDFHLLIRLNHMNTQIYARTMRRNPTEAERILWGCLRKRSLGGSKFSRQIRIGPFIADFVCREKKLIVEVDGVTHGEDHEVAYDISRTAFLEAQGYRVLRVSNHGVYTERDGVLHAITMALEG